MKVKESFLSLGHFTINNGENIRFWEDNKRLGNTTLLCTGCMILSARR
jgi:hypothetical protein